MVCSRSTSSPLALSSSYRLFPRSRAEASRKELDLGIGKNNRSDIPALQNHPSPGAHLPLPANHGLPDSLAGGNPRGQQADLGSANGGGRRPHRSAAPAPRPSSLTKSMEMPRQSRSRAAPSEGSIPRRSMRPGRPRGTWPRYRGGYSRVLSRQKLAQSTFARPGGAVDGDYQFTMQI